MISTDTPANVTPGLWPAHGRFGRKPGRATALWAASYLAVSGMVLLITGHGWIALLHVGLLSLIGWAAASRGKFAQRVFDLAPPLIVIALAYGEVTLLIAGFVTPFHDVTVQRWDAVLFGIQPSHDLAAKVPVLAVSELLHAGYLSFYLALSIPPLLLYARGRAEAFEETMLTLAVTWILGCALFVAFPAEGPRFLWSSPPGIPDGPFRRLSMSILAAGSVRGTAFPSLHMAASLSQTVMAWRWQSKWLRTAMTVSTVLIGIGAVYAGYHYAVDMLAGAMLGAIATAAVIAQNSIKRSAAPIDSVARVGDT
jgi:membrane-associated phospholipid phosphatase